jgi:hypothetical protein
VGWHFELKQMWFDKPYCGRGFAVALLDVVEALAVLGIEL